MKITLDKVSEYKYISKAYKGIFQSSKEHTKPKGAERQGTMSSIFSKGFWGVGEEKALEGEAIFGGRAIVRGGMLDIVSNRTSLQGNKVSQKELLERINGGLLKSFREEVEGRLQQFRIPNHEVLEVKTSDPQVKAWVRKTHGYLHFNFCLVRG